LVLVQARSCSDAAYGTLLRGRRQVLHAAIATAIEEQSAAQLEREAAAGERAALLAHHWIRAEHWEKALNYSLDAAKRAEKLYARSEAISYYWQALDLIDRLPRDVEKSRLDTEVILLLSEQPGWMRDDAGKGAMELRVDRALAEAAQAGNSGILSRLEALKAFTWNDEPLLIRAIERAADSQDTGAQAYAAARYGAFLGRRGKFEKALVHSARAVDLMGVLGKRLEQGILMAGHGRCYYARAGQLEESIEYAARVQEIGNALDDARLRAYGVMEAEAYMYQGDWNAVVQAEAAMPTAREIREWSIVLHSSAWIAIGYLKLNAQVEARQVLERAFKGVPSRAFGQYAFPMTFAQIALAQVHLAAGDTTEALSVADRALDMAKRGDFGLEEGVAYRVRGQVYQAIGDKAEAESSFRRSLDILEGLQSRPELAQTLLAYGQFRVGDNELQDYALMERALRLFEEMNATGWIAETRAALVNVSLS
jgi:hypothetical protein